MMDLLTSLLSLVKMLSTLSDCTIKDIISFSTFQRHPIRNKVRRLNYSVDAEYSHCYQVKICVVAYNEEIKTLGALKNIHFINSFKIFTALRSSYSSVRRTLLIFLNSWRCLLFRYVLFSWSTALICSFVRGRCLVLLSAVSRPEFKQWEL
jgi:hypothetical protein